MIAPDATPILTPLKQRSYPVRSNRSNRSNCCGVLSLLLPVVKSNYFSTQYRRCTASPLSDKIYCNLFNLFSRREKEDRAPGIEPGSKACLDR